MKQETNQKGLEYLLSYAQELGLPVERLGESVVEECLRLISQPRIVSADVSDLYHTIQGRDGVAIAIRYTKISEAAEFDTAIRNYIETVLLEVPDVRLYLQAMCPSGQILQDILVLHLAWYREITSPYEDQFKMDWVSPPTEENVPLQYILLATVPSEKPALNDEKFVNLCIDF